MCAAAAAIAPVPERPRIVYTSIRRLLLAWSSSSFLPYDSVYIYIFYYYLKQQCLSLSFSRLGFLLPIFSFLFMKRHFRELGTAHTAIHTEKCQFMLQLRRRRAQIFPPWPPPPFYFFSLLLTVCI